jgi:hypothetical protein
MQFFWAELDFLRGAIDLLMLLEVLRKFIFLGPVAKNKEGKFLSSCPP